MEPQTDKIDDASLAKLQDLLGTLTGTGNCPLWDVISALRGPDKDEMSMVKDATTSVIRHKLGISEYIGLIVRPDTETAAQVRRNIDSYMADYHFVFHAKRAFGALGLKWDELNR